MLAVMLVYFPKYWYTRIAMVSIKVKKLCKMTIFSILCTCITLCITACINPADLDAFLADEKVEDIAENTIPDLPGNSIESPELGNDTTKQVIPLGADITLSRTGTIYPQSVSLRVINDFFFDTFNWYLSPDSSLASGNASFTINSNASPFNSGNAFYDCLVIASRASVPYSRNFRIWVVD